MPAEDKGRESLQDVLKELLSSSVPEEAQAPESDSAASSKKAEVTPDPQQATVQDTPGVSRTALARHAYEVEIIPPEATGPSPASGFRLKDRRGRSSTVLPRPSDIADALLEGNIHIQVMPTVPPERFSQFEQALKEQPGIRWLGTWGRSKHGTTVDIQLDSPTRATALFRGPTAAERIEVNRQAKGGWLVKLSLQPEAGATIQAPDIIEVVPAHPASMAATDPVQHQYQPQQSFSEPTRQIAAGETDLEASPIASLDVLNRFERLLASLSPHCRVVNVLSLDGVSTVLITLEGIDGDSLAACLPEKISGIQLEVTRDRLVARLPEKW